MSGRRFGPAPDASLRASMAEALALVRSGELQQASSLLLNGLQGRSASPSADSTKPAPAPRKGATRFAPAVVDDVEDRRAVPTARDEASPSASISDAPGRFERVAFRHGSAEQPFHLYGPSRAAPASGRPLILMLHGCTQDAPDFALGTRMNATAEGAGALVLYPSQARAANANGCWNWFRPEDQSANAGEPALLLAMVRQVAAFERVDARRVYVAGLSAGGAMAAVLAREYPEVFAAAGVHSGLVAGAAHSMMGALSAMKSGAKGHEPLAGTRPSVPLIVFHGDQDATVHPRNGEQLLRAAGQQAPAQTLSGTTADGQGYTRTTVGATAAGPAHAEHWLLHGAGHAWSGGDARGSYTNAHGVDASREMLRFFLQHTRTNEFQRAA